MRLLIAMMKHETNTFSPVPTGWERFADWGMHQGEEVPRALAGTNTPVGAYIDLAREVGAEMVTPMAAEAMPSGPARGPCWRSCGAWPRICRSPAPTTCIVT